MLKIVLESYRSEYFELPTWMLSFYIQCKECVCVSTSTFTDKQFIKILVLQHKDASPRHFRRSLNRLENNVHKT